MIKTRLSRRKHRIASVLDTIVWAYKVVIWVRIIIIRHFEFKLLINIISLSPHWLLLRFFHASFSRNLSSFKRFLKYFMKIVSAFRTITFYIINHGDLLNDFSPIFHFLSMKSTKEVKLAIVFSFNREILIWIRFIKLEIRQENQTVKLNIEAHYFCEKDWSCWIPSTYLPTSKEKNLVACLHWECHHRVHVWHWGRYYFKPVLTAF